MSKIEIISKTDTKVPLGFKREFIRSVQMYISANPKAWKHTTTVTGVLTKEVIRPKRLAAQYVVSVTAYDQNNTEVPQKVVVQGWTD